MLAKLLPTKILLRLATPYLAGWNSKDALSLAKSIWARNNFSSTLDVLGEESTSSEQCEAHVQTYIDLIDQISNDPLPVEDKRYQPTISFKPSMFCVVYSPDILPGQQYLDQAFARMKHIVDYANKHHVQMTLEAEDHKWTDFHLDSYFALLAAGYNNLGTVVQTRLFRTMEDLKRFDNHTRVRLVIGIYNEDAQIAYKSNQDMKEGLIACSHEHISKGAYVELATHDQKYIDKFFTHVVLPLRAGVDQFETQFLLGVPRLRLQQMLTSGEYFKKWDLKNVSASQRSYIEILAQSGTLVRLYLPFGSGEVAGPYCKRRLQHNPNLLIYGVKNLLHL